MAPPLKPYTAEMGRDAADDSRDLLPVGVASAKNNRRAETKTQHKAATARYLSQNRERKRSEKPGKDMVSRPKRKGKGVGYARGRY